jgi:hypothetical protein
MKKLLGACGGKGEAGEVSSVPFRSPHFGLVAIPWLFSVSLYLHASGSCFFRSRAMSALSAISKAARRKFAALQTVIVFAVGRRPEP